MMDCSGDPPKHEDESNVCPKPAKQRRFDMMTPMNREQKTHTADCEQQETNIITQTDQDAQNTKEKTSQETKEMHNTQLSVTDGSAVQAIEKCTPHDGEDGDLKSSDAVQVVDREGQGMEMNMILQTLEVQHGEGLPIGMEGQKSAQCSSGNGNNIFDNLFLNFANVKMKEVENAAIGVSHSDSGPGGEEQQEQGSSRLREIARVLDAEITSIKSRSVVTNFTNENLSGSDSDKQQVTNTGSKSVDLLSDIVLPSSSNSAGLADMTAGTGISLAASPTVSAAFIVDLKESGTSENPQAHGAICENSDHGKEVASVLAKKPLQGTKKLGLSIGQESLARILGKWKKGRILEDGEVASSTDSDAEKVFKPEGAEDGIDDSETEGKGSGSAADKEKKDGKSSKSKKQKKHKHKHKKKKSSKKHRSKSKEKGKESEDERSSICDEKRSSKDGDTEDIRKESQSKAKKKKKSSQRRSRSIENFDPWDARNYRLEDKPRDRSRSPLDSSRWTEHTSRKGSRSRDRSRDRSRSRDRRRQRGRSKDSRKSRSHSNDSERSRDRSRHHSKDKSRGESRERTRHRSKEDSKDRSKDQRRSCDRDKEKRRDRDYDSDKEKSRSSGSLKIDKNKLRKIAITNALANMEKYQGPTMDLTAVKSGGKSVAELTEFCRRIAEKEKEAGNVSSSDSDNSEDREGSDAEDGPLHHPFVMRDPSTLPNIIMNIRNSKQLPVLTPQEKQTQSATLRTQFPVSSGTQHRIKESEWVPVTPTTAATTSTTTKAVASAAAPVNTTPASVQSVPTPTVQVAPVGGVGGVLGGVPGGGGYGAGEQTMAPPVAPAQQSVFPALQANMNISSIISERLQAMRRLETNPFDVQALSSVHRMNEKANMWAQSKQLPGLFTGSTDIRILSQEELAGPDKRNQAWVKKDQFQRAPPVRGGIGMAMLQKMGWKPGDGLGKDNEGNKEPLMLDIKMDRKGLATRQDNPHTVRSHPTASRAKDLSGKHPVSALTELCTKRKWLAPAFDLVSETGPDHKKMFLFKVKVNGTEYKPAVACGNKKLAKAQAAAVCLQTMGLIPWDYVVQVARHGFKLKYWKSWVYHQVPGAVALR